MKNRFSCLNFSLLILLNLVFSVAVYARAAKKEGVIEQCLIVSDIHFSPLYGTPNDTALRRKLETGGFEVWKKTFEGSGRQMAVNANLLYQDANYGVVKSALANMKKRLPHPAFIIIAGDFIWHGATPADSVLKRKTIQFIARLFKESFPGTAIIPAMGNNDTYGTDYALQDSKFLNDFADAWSPNLPKAAADSLKANGYYAVKTGNLKLVVINSAMVGYGSKYPQMAANQFNWLQSSLSATANKNVWIIMHIPPGTNAFNGSNFWNADYTQTFVNTVVKYAPKVRFIIASHTHFNDFKVFYNTANEPVSFMRVVPSICSNHGNNPSFEIAELNSTTGRVIKETNYYLNLVALPKDNSITQFDWNETLSSSTTLNIEKPDAKGFSKLMDDIRANKSWQPLTNYVKFYTVSTKTDSSIRMNRVNYMKYLKADSLKGK